MFAQVYGKDHFADKDRSSVKWFQKLNNETLLEMIIWASIESGRNAKKCIYSWKSTTTLLVLDSEQLAFLCTVALNYQCFYVKILSRCKFRNLLLRKKIFFKHITKITICIQASKQSLVIHKSVYAVQSMQEPLGRCLPFNKAKNSTHYHKHEEHTQTWAASWQPCRRSLKWI